MGKHKGHAVPLVARRPAPPPPLQRPAALPQRAPFCGPGRRAGRARPIVGCEQQLPRTDSGWCWWQGRESRHLSRAAAADASGGWTGAAAALPCRLALSHGPLVRFGTLVHPWHAGPLLEWCVNPLHGGHQPLVTGMGRLRRWQLTSPASRSSPGPLRGSARLIGRPTGPAGRLQAPTAASRRPGARGRAWACLAPHVSAGRAKQATASR